MRLLGVILLISFACRATHAGDSPALDVPAGHEHWVGAHGERVVDVRDLRPTAKAELDRLLRQGGYRPVTGSGRDPGVRRDLRTLVENQGRFPPGYRPAAAGPAGEAAEAVAPVGSARWLAEREAAMVAARFQRRLGRAFGRRSGSRQLQPPLGRKNGVAGPKRR